MSRTHNIYPACLPSKINVNKTWVQSGRLDVVRPGLGTFMMAVFFFRTDIKVWLWHQCYESRLLRMRGLGRSSTVKAWVPESSLWVQSPGPRSLESGRRPQRWEDCWPSLSGCALWEMWGLRISGQTPLSEHIQSVPTRKWTQSGDHLHIYIFRVLARLAVKYWDVMCGWSSLPGPGLTVPVRCRLTRH